jgi:hypothetical protein
MWKRIQLWIQCKDKINIVIVLFFLGDARFAVSSKINSHKTDVGVTKIPTQFMKILYINFK